MTKGRWISRKMGPSAVRDASLVIEPGETLALVGESGSGKTTIARAITGLVRPSEGSIRYEDADITDVPARRRSQAVRREIQYVFQNPDSSLNPKRSVGYSLSRPLQLFFGLSGRELFSRVNELLAATHLDADYRYRFPRQLSGGERQRVALARALAAEPRVIVCDEIASALDVSVQANILDLLMDLQRRLGIAYLFISHDLAVVRWLAHRVTVLHRGTIVEEGTAEKVFTPPYHRYTRTLIESVPKPHPDRSLLSASQSATRAGSDATA
ncbi:MAG: ABC transporter ATP-binding protein [Nitriliruptorales bacterium]